MSTQEPYEEYDAPKGLWTRMRERVFGVDAAEEEMEEDPAVPSARRRAAIRLETARGVRVALRLHATVFNDARVAADGLKSGQQQIVNLEKSTPEMAGRIFDFLSGVAYALDGSVEKIGDKVFLFAPANVHIEVDGGTESR